MTAESENGARTNDVLVVVTGLPASGKSSLAVPLARCLGFSVLSKDVIKESLFDSIGPAPNIGQASIDVMFALARQPGSMVLDSFFWKGKAEGDLIETNKHLVQIHCKCPVDVARRRYENRSRHDAHQDVTPDWEAWYDLSGPLELPAPLLSVDTTQPVDVANLAELVTSAILNQASNENAGS